MSELDQDLDCNILYHPGEFGGEFGSDYNYSLYAEYYSELYGNGSIYNYESQTDEGDQNWEKNFKFVTYFFFQQVDRI